MNFLVPSVMVKIVSLLFYKDCFGIKNPTKVDIPSNKEIKTNCVPSLIVLI